MDTMTTKADKIGVAMHTTTPCIKPHEPRVLQHRRAGIGSNTALLGYLPVCLHLAYLLH